MPYIREYRKMAYEKASDYGRKAHARTRQQSYRKTIGIVLGMLVVLIGAGIAIPHVLPGGPQTDEALVGRAGGIAIVHLENGAGKQLLYAPPAGEAYTTWALSLDRSMFLVVWCHETKPGDPSSADRLALQLRSTYNGGQRWQYTLGSKDFSAADLRVGYIPGSRDFWLLSRGRLWIMDDSSGAVSKVSMPPRLEIALTSVAFSPNGRQVAFAGSSGGYQMLYVAGLKNGKFSDPKVLDDGEIAFPTNNTSMLMEVSWDTGTITSLSLPSSDLIAVGLDVPADSLRTLSLGQAEVLVASLTSIGGSRWYHRPIGGTIASISASPARSALAVFSSLQGVGRLTTFSVRAAKSGASAGKPGTVVLGSSATWRAPAAWSAP